MSADTEMANPSEVPLIETERLRLRGHCPEDLSSCAQMWADPAVTQHIGGRAYSTEEVWARMLRYAGHWSWLGFGFWLVEEKSTGEFVGEVGFADHHRELEPPIDRTPELGWVLASTMSGRGYATESARAAIAWFDAHFAPVRTVCLIAPDNRASIRVAKKCSYLEKQRTAYYGFPLLLFERG